MLDIKLERVSGRLQYILSHGCGLLILSLEDRKNISLP